MGMRRIAGVAVTVLCLAVGAALANPNQDGGSKRDRDRNERGGLQETVSVRVIPISEFDRQIQLTTVIIASNTDRVLGASTETGVQRVDEDRFDLGGIPLIGGLFGGDEDEDEGPTFPLRIGTAYVIGSSLAVDLRKAFDGLATDGTGSVDPQSVSTALADRIAAASGAETPTSRLAYRWNQEIVIDGVKVLHRNYSYEMPGGSFVDIGSLKEASAASGEAGASGGKVPLLGDIPLAGGLFGRPAGGAYLEGRKLVVVIKPSIHADRYED